MLTALRHPRFARLLGALTVSTAGDWLYNLALLAFVYDRTGSSAWVGATTAARVLPIVLAGPFGGVVADRFDRRRVMIASDVVRTGLMAALALVAAFALPVVLAPVLAALATLAASPYPSCVAATTPRLVPDEDLAAANAARTVINPVCIVAGPVLGAVLLLVGPASVAFALNGLTFALSAVLVLTIPAGAAFGSPSGSAEQERPKLLADLRAGAGALLAAPRALRLVGADIGCSVIYGAQTVLLLVVAHRLGLGGEGYGLLLAAIGAGGVLGAVLAGRIPGAERSPRILAAALLGVALPLPLLAVAPDLAAALVLCVVGGMGAVAVEVMCETGLQRTLEPEVVGRAYGFAFPAAIGGIVIGSLVAPVLLGALGLAGALGLLGAGLTAYALSFAGARAAAAPEPVAAPAV
jgi:predicted MFS family arabinose efflux permease